MEWGSSDDHDSTCDKSKLVTKYNDLANISVPLTLLSSILSVLGSILIIVVFALMKDVRRSTARVILLFLAIADLGTGLGYIIASIGYYELYNAERETERAKVFCKVQSFITTYFPVCSFFWTATMGFYFLMALVFRRPKWGPKILIIFNIIIWGAPAILHITLTGLGILGGLPSANSTSTSGAWCFVSSGNEAYHNLTLPHLNYILFEGFAGKYLEILACIIIICCYGAILVTYRINCKCTKKSNEILSSSSSNDYGILNRAIHGVDVIFMLIPAFFILLRIWGHIRYFASIQCRETGSNTDHFCMSSRCYYLLYSFTFYLEALCDPAQGFGNAILFVLLSKGIRVRIIRGIYLVTHTVNDGETSSLLDKRHRPNMSITYSPGSARKHDNGVDSDDSDIVIKYSSIRSTTEKQNNN